MVVVRDRLASTDQACNASSGTVHTIRGPNVDCSSTQWAENIALVIDTGFHQTAMLSVASVACTDGIRRI